MSDDYRNTFNGAGTLGAVAPGGSANGSIETSNDIDVFAVTLTAGHTYSFQLQGQGAGALPDTSLTLENAAGSYLTSDLGFSTGDPSQFYFTATTSGTYYLAAGGEQSASTGTYTVSVSAGFVDDYRDVFNDTNEALGHVTPGGSANGTIEISNDTDVFAVTLVAGTTYSFQLQGQGAGALPDTSLTLENAAGSYLTSDLGFSIGDPSQFYFTATTTGTYYLAAGGEQSASTGTYTVSVSAGFVDDYRDVFNDTNEALGHVTPGSSTNGTIEISNDTDVFAVTLTAGHTYSFQLQGQGGSALPDTSLTLENAAGSYLTSDLGFSTGDPSQFYFTPTTSGTYYLAAGGEQSASTGTYTVSVSAGFVDDYRDVFNDTNEALGHVTPGGSANGTIEISNDTDVFAVTLTAGHTYSFQLQGQGGSALPDTSLTLENAAGSYLDSDLGFSSGDPSLFNFTATTSGTYYLVAQGEQSASTGTYTVSVSSGFVDDYRDTYNDPSEPLGQATPGHGNVGTIEIGGDVDVFAVTLQSGQTYTFNLAPRTGSTLPDTSLTLENASGSYITSDTGGAASDPATFQYSPTATGTYYLAAAGGLSTGVGTYVMTVTGGPAIDDFRDIYNDSSEALGFLPSDGSNTGRVETTGDKDVFAVTLSAGQSYTFDLAGSAFESSALANPFLTLMDANGAVLLSNDNYVSINSRIIYTPATSGTFYLEARSAVSGGLGDYVISSHTNFDDYRDSRTDTTAPFGTLVNGASRVGSIETAGDQDWFSATLTAGQSYTFSLLHSATGGAALADPFLRLLDANGKLLLSDNDFNGVDSRIVFTPSTSGTYYLDASSAGSTGVGNYILNEKLNYDDARDSVGDTTVPNVALTVNTAHLGSIETAGDVDYYSVVLYAGHSYTFDAVHSATGGPALANPFLTLTDSNGVAILFDDNFNGNDARIVYTASVTGTYYVSVSSSSSSAIGNYSVSARLNFDDFADSVKDTTAPFGSIVAGGALRLGSIEHAADADLFSVTLTAGQSYTFDVAGNSTGGSALVDTLLYLRNSSGTALIVNDDFNGHNSRIVYVPTVSGTYYLDVRSAVAGGTGNYAISEKINADDWRDSINDPTSPFADIAVGSSKQGAIETPGDSDIFRFTLQAGHTYEMDLNDAAAGMGHLHNGDIQLLNSAGTMLAYNDEVAGTMDAQILFTASTTGTYYLNVRGVSTNTGDYTVSVLDEASASAHLHFAAAHDFVV